MDKNVEKQLIVRTFEPDMAVLKQVAKQMNGMQDVALNLFGQAGEVLIVITARAHAPAAATELTERIAERFEMALGDAAYGRGKGSVAYFAAGELMQAEALVAASDPKTGGLLGEEFSHTKRGANVFDFGDSSYQDSRVAAKIKTMAAKNCDATYPPQVAAARAAAAAKCSKAEFGVSVTGLGKAGRDVYMAVAYGGQVYVRRFAQTPDAGKRCALAALDTIRRLLQGADTPAMRVFKANSDFDWDAPEAPRKKGRPAAGGAGNKNSGTSSPTSPSRPSPACLRAAPAFRSPLRRTAAACPPAPRSRRAARLRRLPRQGSPCPWARTAPTIPSAEAGRLRKIKEVQKGAGPCGPPPFSAYGVENGRGRGCMAARRA